MSHYQFAKIFNSEEYGQILVTKGRNSECDPAVTIEWWIEAIGSVSIAFGFEDNNEGWENMDKSFDNTTEEVATKGVAESTDKYLGRIEAGKE